MIRALPVPSARPPRPGRKRKIVALTTLGLAGLLAGLLTGCGAGNSNRVNTTSPSPSAKSYAAVAGNWKFSTGSSAGLTSVAGSLSVNGTTISAILHPLAATCAKTDETFSASGSIAASGLLTITSSKFSGGTLVVSGALAADQHSLTNPTFTLSGGPCAASGPGPSTRSTAAPAAQQFQPLTGNYNGSFTDISGAVLLVSATLSQPTQPDVNGVYHLTGYATFSNNSCLSTPVITDSAVTGDTIQATYTDKDTGNTVIGNGTLSPNAQTLTITHWILSGCGNDTGTGLLERQTN